MAARAPLRTFRRYGDVMVNLALVEVVQLRQSSGMFGTGSPAIEFWGHRHLSFPNQGPDTHPVVVKFDSVHAAQEEYERLNRHLTFGPWTAGGEGGPKTEFECTPAPSDGPQRPQ